MKYEVAEDKKTKIYNILFWAILIAGIGLRTYQYAINRSLWHDEAHLALNFVDLGFLGLTQPLENFQSAPLLFLWSVEAVSHVFGLGEMSLRLVPFLFSIITVPIFYYLVRDLTKNRLAATIAFLVFALNLSFVYYSSELKPYTIDVSAFIILSYLSISGNAYVERNRVKLLIIAGCLLALFSNAAQLVCVCCAAYYVTQTRIIKTDKPMLAMPLRYVYVLCAWFAIIILNYLTFVHNHPYADGMKNIWSFSFCPTPLFGPAFNNYMKFYFPDMLLNEILLMDRTYFMEYALLLLTLTGLVHAIVKKQWDLVVFGLLPLLMAYFLSIMNAYPFYPRFILYVMPGIIILMSMGATVLINKFGNVVYQMTATAVVLVFVVLLVKNSIIRFPRYDIKVKPTLEYIGKHFPKAHVFVTTPYSMCEYYKKTGYFECGDVTRLQWDLNGDSFLSDTVIKQQTKPFIVLRSLTGDDNSDVFIPQLKEKGLVISEFRNGNFGVAEIKPESKQ